MGLRALFANVAKVAFAAAGDVAQPGTYRSSPARTYSPAADRTTTVWAVSDPVTIVLYDADLRVEIPGPVKDRRTGIIQLSQITGGAVAHGDQIEVGGIFWNVFQAETDPANATATLHLWSGLLDTVQGITTEDGLSITTEDGQTIEPE